MKNARDIIIKPVLTEKTMNMGKENKYTFSVDKKANKIEIRKAVEAIFGVKVLNVHTTTVRKKLRRTPSISQNKRGRVFPGFTKEWKKAMVTLKKGEKIQVGGVNLFEN